VLVDCQQLSGIPTFQYLKLVMGGRQPQVKIHWQKRSQRWLDTPRESRSQQYSQELLDLQERAFKRLPQDLVLEVSFKIVATSGSSNDQTVRRGYVTATLATTNCGQRNTEWLPSPNVTVTKYEVGLYDDRPIETWAIRVERFADLMTTALYLEHIPPPGKKSYFTNP
jgi:hypothetical protein